MQLTVKALRSLAAGKWISDGAVRGSGALWARGGEGGGVSLYFRHKRAGKAETVPLKGYDESGAKGLTLPQAREKAKALTKLLQSGVAELGEHLEREREAAERALREAEEGRAKAKADAGRGTLKQLIDGYVAHLEKLGKQSTGDVRSIFDKHVIKAAPDVLSKKAAEVTVDTWVEIIGKLVDAGHGRTANKLRSYARAAYQLAIEARHNPAAPAGLRGFGITVNPLASIGNMPQFNKARDRHLSAPELGAYLRHLDALRPGVQRDALQLLLYTGGQRAQQLLRAAAGDVDLAASTITLRDGKGARTQPRLHVLPLVPAAKAILERRLAALKDGEPLFSTDERTQMRHETISTVVADISAAMVKAKEATPFQLRDLRRTTETMLASLKVSSDVRAQLQSHGLGGVQAKHYDRHSYSSEKLLALTKWSKHLAMLKANEKASVTNIAGRKRNALQRQEA